ncbi:MAG: 30S ribosomal protein S16 [Planctomycetota bacterium]
MAVRIRLKKMGRTHRPFFRLVAMDQRSPRDGRVIEQLGYYDPMCPETDARAILKADRIQHWISVGAQPSEKAAVLIRKYGHEGTHLEAQAAAMERLGKRKDYTPQPVPPPAAPAPEPVAEEAPAEASSTEETAGEETATENAAPAAESTENAAE